MASAGFSRVVHDDAPAISLEHVTLSPSPISGSASAGVNAVASASAGILQDAGVPEDRASVLGIVAVVLAPAGVAFEVAQAYGGRTVGLVAGVAAGYWAYRQLPPDP